MYADLYHYNNLVFRILQLSQKLPPTPLQLISCPLYWVQACNLLYITIVLHFIKSTINRRENKILHNPSPFGPSRIKGLFAPSWLLACLIRWTTPLRRKNHINVQRKGSRDMHLGSYFSHTYIFFNLKNLGKKRLYGI